MKKTIYLRTNILNSSSITKERKKVKFSLTKFTKKGSNRTVGFGEIDDENLYTKSKIYEDCIRYCQKKVNSTNEFKGSLIIAQKNTKLFFHKKVN